MNNLTRDGRAGEILRARRKRAKIKLIDAAARAGCSASYLSQVESGRRQIVADAFLALYDYYGGHTKTDDVSPDRQRDLAGS